MSDRFSSSSFWELKLLSPAGGPDCTCTSGNGFIKLNPVSFASQICCFEDVGVRNLVRYVVGMCSKKRLFGDTDGIPRIVLRRARGTRREGVSRAADARRK